MVWDSNPRAGGFPDRRFSKPLLLASQPTIHKLVGMAGFEPATLWFQTICATRLRYTPKGRDKLTAAIPVSVASLRRAYFRLHWLGDLLIRRGAYGRISAGISSPRRLLRDLTTPGGRGIAVRYR